ncbi:hypothetical protein H9P43_000828 [Blastocladiella emersonii ATCC 22665]|nr:hypothetical protein H9P43_000828 [Blastocladiella emersonii ATCC 22665]
MHSVRTASLLVRRAVAGAAIARPTAAPAAWTPLRALSTTRAGRATAAAEPATSAAPEAAPESVRGVPKLRAAAQDADAFPRAHELTTEDLIVANTHVGHARSRWTSQNLPYILGTRQGVHIIDPNQTLAHLRRAATVTKLVAAQNGVILFVANNAELHPIATEAAVHGAAYYVTSWVPGTLTNAQQVVVKRQAITDLDQALPATAPKPDLVVVLDITHGASLKAVKEARKLNIPTVALVDTDVDPRWVTYPIPANDDNLRSVATIARTLAQAARDGFDEAKRTAVAANRNRAGDANRIAAEHEPAELDGWAGDIRMM